VLLGWLALYTDDAEERQAALAEGEALLNAGGLVSHNYLLFYRAAIEAALDTGDWDAAERYAAAAEDYTRSEPLPWIDFIIARGHALAAWGRGQRDSATSAALGRLLDEARRIGWAAVLPALEAALADAPVAGGTSTPRVSA
jgi:hypothetical protein